MVISGIKDGDTADSAVTKGALDDLKEKLGLDGKDGAAHDGKDGQDGRSIIDQVASLRDGTAGTVVYTNAGGDRVQKLGDKFYKLDDIKVLEQAGAKYLEAGKAGSGKPAGWYTGNAVDGYAAVTADPNAGDNSAAKLLDTLQKNAVSSEALNLSLVNANGKTTTPTKLSNVADGVNDHDAVNKSQLDAVEAKADNAAATANAGFTLNTGTREVVDGKVVVKETDNVGQVKPNTTVVMVDGKNTKVSKVNSDSSDVISYTIEVNGIPMSYVNASGDVLVKVGDKFFLVNPDGSLNLEGKVEKDGQKVDADVKVAGVKMIQPDATDKSKAGNAQKLGNVADGEVSASSKDAINV